MQEHSLLDPGAVLVVVTLSTLLFPLLLSGMIESVHVGLNDPCPSSNVSVLSESNISVRQGSVNPAGACSNRMGSMIRRGPSVGEITLCAPRQFLFFFSLTETRLPSPDWRFPKAVSREGRRNCRTCSKHLHRWANHSCRNPPSAM